MADVRMTEVRDKFDWLIRAAGIPSRHKRRAFHLLGVADKYGRNSVEFEREFGKTPHDYEILAAFSVAPDSPPAD